MGRYFHAVRLNKNGEPYRVSSSEFTCNYGAARELKSFFRFLGLTYPHYDYEVPGEEYFFWMQVQFPHVFKGETFTNTVKRLSVLTDEEIWEFFSKRPDGMTREETIDWVRNGICRLFATPNSVGVVDDDFIATTNSLKRAMEMTTAYES